MTDRRPSETDRQGDPLVAALARLNGALDGLSKAVGAASERNANARNADESVQLLSEDRAALARKLDSTEARARKLADTNSEVSRRLVGAMETVRGVLETSDK